MPSFAKKVMSQYLRTQCERQLKLSLYTNSERKNIGMPEEDKLRGQILLLAEEGMLWQATVLGHLDATFGASHIIGTRKPGYRNQFEKTPLINLIGQIQPNCFIVEAKYELEAPAQVFRNALNLTNIQDFQGNLLKFSAVIPDLIQVFDPTDRFFSSYVTPHGDVLPIPTGDSRLQLRIIDVKLTSEPGANYFAEVAYYAMTLAGWLEDNHLDAQFVVVPEAAVWPGSHQASSLRQHMEKWGQQGHTPSFRELIGAMQEDIEVVEFDIFAPLIRRMLQEKIPTILQEPEYTEHDWHVSTHCNSCDFLGYPWGQELPDPPTPNSKHCWLTAQHQNHLSRIAYMSRGSSSVLRESGILDVLTLSQQDSTHGAFQKHQELKAQKTVIPSRAVALINDTSFIAPSSGTSAVMPRWADLKLFISTEFDLSSAISFSFGIKAFWYEPFLNDGVTGRRQHNAWEPLVFFVGTRSIQQEEQVFLAFLKAIRQILNETGLRDDEAINSARRTQRSKMQFYLWDGIQQDHFIRVVGRHLDAILGEQDLKDLAWLFPSEELMPNPKTITRQSPITIVSDAVRSHLAVPVPHRIVNEITYPF